MDTTKNIAEIETSPGVPITVQEYANQYNVCPATVKQWFKHGKKVVTVNLDLQFPGEN